MEPQRTDEVVFIQALIETRARDTPASPAVDA
jgi:hypothetical protein